MIKLLLFTSIYFCLSFSYSTNNELVIEVTGIKGVKKGNLRIGIFKKDGFLKPDKAVDGKIIPVTNNTMTISFKNLPSGTYGIAVVHDQDKNGKLSLNMVGFPTEPYGFSNNKFGLFGPPSFEDASVELVEGKKVEIGIRLK